MKVGVVHLGMVASGRLQEEGGVPDHQAVTGPLKGLNRRSLQGAFSKLHFEKEVQSCSFLWGAMSCLCKFLLHPEILPSALSPENERKSLWTCALCDLISSRMSVLHTACHCKRQI